MSHPTGQPAMLVALAAAFDKGALENGKYKLREGAKPRVRMQQLAFVVYKVRTLWYIFIVQLLCFIRDP